MSARSRLAASVVFLASVSCVRFDPPQGGQPGFVTFEAQGTADAQGTIAAGEWDRGDCTQFPVKVPGGTTVNADICMMNDGQNLYSMVRYPRTTVDSTLSFGLNFTSPTTGGVPGTLKDIDEYITEAGSAGTFPFTDAFDTALNTSARDIDAGGTTDGKGGIGTGGGMHVYELQHVLDSADDAHDYSLKAGDLIHFCATVRVGSETTVFPAACFGSPMGPFIGRIKIAQQRTGPAMYSGDFAGRVCGVRGVQCPPSQSPTLPNPCAEKPALCEKPQFQEAGMFLYCTIKPCVVHDELPRNCLVKYPCPAPPGGLPPYYHLTFTGLRDDWDVMLVDRAGGKVAHRVVPIEGGVVVSFQPDRDRHRPGSIGDYVAMFVMRDSGRAGVRYEVGARFATSDRHFEAPGR